MDYQDYLKSPDWQQKRQTKLSRKNNTKKRCAICGSTKDLHTHHLIYRNLYDVQQGDLRLLCKRCHFLAHDLMKKGLIKYKSDNQHHRFTILKGAVKKYLGIYNTNCFYPENLSISPDCGQAGIGAAS